jgi:hypothetical protein
VKPCKPSSDIGSVTVRPLAEPFGGKVTYFKFDDWDKILAVSKADGDAIIALMYGVAIGRQVVIEPVEDGMIRVSIAQ